MCPTFEINNYAKIDLNTKDPLHATTFTYLHMDFLLCPNNP